MLDADGSTDPAEYPGLRRSLVGGGRLRRRVPFPARRGTEDMPLHRQFGNWCFVMAVRLLLAVPIRTSATATMLSGNKPSSSWIWTATDSKSDGDERATLPAPVSKLPKCPVSNSGVSTAAGGCRPFRMAGACYKTISASDGRMPRVAQITGMC